MKKIGVCGHFGIGMELFNGQTIKTKIVTNELKRIFGNENIFITDTHGGIKSFPSMLINSFRMFFKCENIVIMPAYRGLVVLSIVFFLYNTLFHRRIHYVVIGGWLDQFIAQRNWIRIILKKYQGIYVETLSMRESLEKQGFDNVFVVPNFKSINIIAENQIKISSKETMKFCTFSRVLKEKGIEEAIDAIKIANSKLDGVKLTLDIYGPVDENYKSEFMNLEKSFPSYVKYGGVVPYEKSVNVIKEYDALLFPTYYKGEGFAGTLIDAMASGVPAIVSDWKYNREIVKSGETGLVVHKCTADELAKSIIWVNENVWKWNIMKTNCLKEAKKYIPEVAIEPLVKRIM